MPADAFFEVLAHDDGVLVARATTHAVGPWDPTSLHAGPPAALLVSAIADHHPAGGRVPTRVSVEILRPVPVAELRVTTGLRRPGRKVDLVQAEMSTADGTALMLASVWRIRRADRPLGVGVEGAPIPGPDGIAASTGFFRPVPHGGYVEAMETRFVHGDWGHPGPAVAWMRQRVPLRDDQPTSGLQRALVAADSGNGLSARVGDGVLGPDALFVNVDLGVHLVREPQGEWIGLDARTDLADGGIGLATTVLHDLHGPFGRGAQSLLVEPG